jgi:hypothetical protein
MQFAQTKDFTDDLSGLMDEVPEEEIPEVGDDNTIPDNDEGDTTLIDEEGPYTLGLDDDDNISK